MKSIITIVVLALFFIPQITCSQENGGQYYTSFDGVKIYYEVKGEGYPVLLIHGFTGTGQGWKNCSIYTGLLKAGYKVILIDQRGNGRSDKPHTDEAYANDAEAKDIKGLISFLHINHYNVVGYSRGSIIAARLLAMDNRLNKTVLGGMGDGFTDPQWPRRIHAYKAIMGDTTLHDVDDMVKYIHSQHFDETALALQQKYQPSTGPKELAKVKKPVLIIRGTEDKENGSETALQKMTPESKLSYVPGNHNTAQRGEPFAAAVLDFFK